MSTSPETKTEATEPRVALVTGSSSGIGRATALAFARTGAHVILASRSAAGNEAVVQQIRAEGGSATYLAADVSKPQDIDDLFHEIKTRFGRLDCAFNNAGIFEYSGSILDCTLETWETLQATNVRSVLLCMQREIRLMLGRGGAIVNCSSVVGLTGMAGPAAYCATKHAIVGLTRAAALEFGTQGIRINVVCPSAVNNTTISATLRQVVPAEHMEAGVRRAHAVGRMAEPHEVAEAVVWLCSPQNVYITGVTLPVDGGYLAGK